jgi:predicted ribosome quality control (RQC) complex YloA/Tae2 family protein
MTKEEAEKLISKFESNIFCVTNMQFERQFIKEIRDNIDLFIETIQLYDITIPEHMKFNHNVASFYAVTYFYIKTYGSAVKFLQHCIVEDCKWIEMYKKEMKDKKLLEQTIRRIEETIDTNTKTINKLRKL